VLEPAKDVAAADHDAHLNPQRVHLRQLCGCGADDRPIDPEASVAAAQGFAAELQNDALVLQPRV
jgi:hypothetical protein